MKKMVKNIIVFCGGFAAGAIAGTIYCEGKSSVDSAIICDEENTNDEKSEAEKELAKVLMEELDNHIIYAVDALHDVLTKNYKDPSVLAKFTNLANSNISDMKESLVEYLICSDSRDEASKLIEIFVEKLHKYEESFGNKVIDYVLDADETENIRMTTEVIAGFKTVTNTILTFMDVMDAVGEEDGE